MIPLDYLRKKYGSLPPGYAVEPSMGVMPEDYAEQPSVEPSPAQRLSEPESDAPLTAPPMVQTEAEPVDPMAAAIEADGSQRLGRNIGATGANFLTRLLKRREPIRGIEAAPSEEARRVGAETREQKTLRDALAQRYAGEGRELQKSQQELQRERQAMEAERLARTDTQRAKQSETAAERQARMDAETVRANRAREGLTAYGISEASKRAETTAEGKAATAAEGKQLPATTAEALADLPTAVSQLDTLGKSFDTMGGGTVAARLSGMLPTSVGAALGTDVSKYESDALLSMQAVGKIMEGGKLAQGDEDKYRRMLPGPRDNPETAKNKITQAKAFLQELVGNRVEFLRRSGYKVPSVPGVEKSEQAKALEGASTRPATVDTSFSPRREPRTMRLPSGEIVEVE